MNSTDTDDARPTRQMAPGTTIATGPRLSAGEIAAGQLVSIQRAMVLAGVSRRTIYNWLDKGKLTYVRTAGGAVRIDVSTLFRFRPAVPVEPPSVAREAGGRFLPAPGTPPGETREAPRPIVKGDLYSTSKDRIHSSPVVPAGECCVLCSTQLTTVEAIARGLCETCG